MTFPNCEKTTKLIMKAYRFQEFSCKKKKKVPPLLPTRINILAHMHTNQTEKRSDGNIAIQYDVNVKVIAGNAILKSF